MALARTEIPSPPGNLLLGHLRAYTRDPLGFMEDLAREQGDLARFRLAHIEVLLLSDPEAIEQVLVRQHDAFRKQRFLRQVVGEAFGEGLLTSEGETWLSHRKLAQPAFRPDRIASYADPMVRLTHRMLEGYEHGQTRDVQADMMRLTLDIATKTLFDVEVGDRADAIGDALEAMMNRFEVRNQAVVILARHLPTPGNIRYKLGLRKLDAIVREIIEERRADPSGDDLLSRLIRASEAGAGPAALTDEDLRDELVTMLLAGHETTALSLSWTIYLLATHPGAFQRLAHEIDTVLGQRPPAPKDLEAMPYLEAVVQEAMRLYPPAWAIGREAKEDVEILGHTIPKGTQLRMSQWVLHRDPRFFDEPSRFEPDRWLDGLADELPRFAYMPFGGGPRTCIGKSFAMLETRLVLATILQRFRFTYTGEQPPVPEPSITLRPQRGMPVRVQAR